MQPQPVTTPRRQKVRGGSIARYDKAIIDLKNQLYAGGWKEISSGEFRQVHNISASLLFVLADKGIVERRPGKHARSWQYRQTKKLMWLKAETALSLVNQYTISKGLRPEHLQHKHSKPLEGEQLPLLPVPEPTLIITADSVVCGLNHPIVQEETGSVLPDPNEGPIPEPEPVPETLYRVLGKPAIGTFSMLTPIFTSSDAAIEAAERVMKDGQFAKTYVVQLIATIEQKTVVIRHVS